MKVTVSYVPEESRRANGILTLLRLLMPDAKIRSSESHPPQKIVYLTTNPRRQRGGT